MKPNKETITFIAIFLSALITLCAFRAMDYREEISKISSEMEYFQSMVLDLVVTDTNKVDIRITDWHIFIDALIEQESGGREKVVGTKDDVGVLQITPIYLEEVNRILGIRKYSLEDRYDKYKSIEMFNILNNRYNPDQCFNKAIQLHNPKAPESYKKSILNKYYRMRYENR